MRESIIELSICLLIGVVALAVVAGEIASGRIANLDGLTVSLISLTLGCFFLFDVYWSYRSGELKDLLKRKPASASQTKERNSEL